MRLLRYRTRLWRGANCLIRIGYLLDTDAWGIAISWGRREPRVEGERLFERSITIAMAADDLEEGIFQYRPAACFHDGTGTVDSRTWTGRRVVLWRVARPMVWVS